ncbi:isocitrate lyase/phosphoenolpyruvate mutase family protein [soil metagenome]
MPNAWDGGSAAMLQHLGFPAIASTSAGFAWSLARRDNTVGLGPVLAHLRALVEAVAVPVNADFEGGFAIDPEDVSGNVALAVSTGVAGLSIEDSTGDAREPLFAFGLAVERIAAARASIDASGTGAILTGRSEGFIAGRPDIDETIRRLEAYSAAGADCLYAPGIRTSDDIRAIVEAVSPKPVNVLVSADFTTVRALADAGVRRISVGGALARVAWAAFISAATELKHDGSFTRLSSAAPSSTIEEPFQR